MVARCSSHEAAGSARTFLSVPITAKGVSNMQDVLSRVRKAFNSAFEVDPASIGMNTVPADVKAWDSMGHVTLASSLEQEFNLTFDVDELMEMENVREIVRIVQAKLAKLCTAVT
jgi:acyl carrier protein